ncbi:MAG: serine/threonine protein kinase [Planctomycetaceae bacterium]|nr:serine/threonine protein kinase [Planctomycetaceae bacterium]
MEKTPTFFDHVRKSGLVEMKKLKRLVESLRVRKRIKYASRADYRSRVAVLQEFGGYGRLPPLEQYLARELLRLDWLNVWQITQLIEGRLRFTLGEYHIIDSLGQGGYAHVFLARSNKTPELAAIKVFQSPQAQPEALTRFLREAMLQESISHKNIVRLIHCGQDGNVEYLVFEYMAGGDVRRLIHNEVQLPILQSARIISQAAGALAFLHRQGIVHRDVKPANILLTESGAAKLGDLGLCGFLDERAKDDPRYGKLAGTADYMAPDHILNPCKPSPQWDIYSLGCTFYQMVTGTVPFPKNHSREKIMAHLRSEPVDPRMFREDLPEELVLVIMRMMAKDPALRFQTMTEVQASLASWERGHSARKPAGQDSLTHGLTDDPDHVVVGAETLQKLLEFSVQPLDKTDGSFPDEAIDLATVRDVPLEPEIYELQKPDEESQSGFSFELPVEPIDEELPLRFDRKSLFEFVSTFEEATRLPYWKLDTLSKLRRSLPLPLRLRFAKREVIIRRFARQMRSGYALDPRCGGERSHIKAEPTLRWYVWWLMTARPYDAYSRFSFLTNAEPVRPGHGGSTNPEHEKMNTDLNPATKELISVRLPGHAEPIVIEVPPMISIATPDHRFSVPQDTANAMEDLPGTITFRNPRLRSRRPFEPLTILFWLFVAVFGIVAALAAVGMNAMIH